MYPPIYRADDGTLVFHLGCDHVVSIDPSDPARMPVHPRPCPESGSSCADADDPGDAGPRRWSPRPRIRWILRICGGRETVGCLRHSECPSIRATSSTPQTRSEEEIDAADCLEEEIVVQVEAMAKVIFARR